MVEEMVKVEDGADVNLEGAHKIVAYVLPCGCTYLPKPENGPLAEAWQAASLTRSLLIGILSISSKAPPCVQETIAALDEYIHGSKPGGSKDCSGQHIIDRKSN